MEINVLGVSQPQVVSKGTKSWNEITVTYTGNKGKQEKRLQSFIGQAYTDFSSVKDFPCTADVTVKKEGDYWQWKGATFNVFPQEGSTKQADNNGTKQATTKSAGNWETADERQAKQRYIVRQSSITAALNLYTLNGKPANVAEVLDVAQQFESFVFGEYVQPETAAARKPGRPSKKDPVELEDPIQ